MKKCCTCKELKPLDEFCKSRGRRDGRNVRCNACCAEYYLANREEILTRQRTRYSNESPQQRLARNEASANWVKNNPEKRLAISRKYDRANTDKTAIRIKKWQLENKDKDRAKGKRWYWNNREKVLAVKQAYRDANPDKRRAAVTRWERANPDACAANHHKRRARLLNAPGLFTAEDMQRLRALQKNKCACCKKKLIKTHRDHIVPLAKGGANNASNIQLLCPTCNLSKHDKDPIHFMQTRGYLL